MKAISLVAAVAAALVLGQHRITAADAARFKFLAAVYFDDKGGGLKQPEGIACDGRGGLVIGDTGNDRVLRFTYQDNKVAGGHEIKIPELSAPSRIHLNSRGEIYVLDGKQRRIVHLDPDGAFKDVLSLDEVPAPATIVPKGFAIDAADNIYLLDVFSARVLVLSAAGQFQRAVPLPADTGFASDLTIDSLGNALVLDSLRRRVYSAGKGATSFAPLGGDLSSLLITLPTSITTSRGAIFIAEGLGGSIVGLGRDGSFLSRQLTPGWKEGSLNHPAQMCVNDKDEVFIADRDNSRVQVFSLAR